MKYFDNDHCEQVQELRDTGKEEDRSLQLFGEA